MSEDATFAAARQYFVGDDRSNREHMLAGDWYVSDDPDSARIATHARRELHRFERAFAEGDQDCWELLRSAIPGLGTGARLLPPVRVDYGDNITVGEGTFANYGLVALDVARIAIGAHCQIGPNVQLLTPVHPLEPTTTSRGPGKRRPDHPGRQRVAGRRRHRVPGGDHREQQRRRSGLSGHPGHPGRQPGRGQPGAGHSRPRRLHLRPAPLTPVG